MLYQHKNPQTSDTGEHCQVHTISDIILHLAIILATSLSELVGLHNILSYKSMHYKPTPFFRADVRGIAHGLYGACTYQVEKSHCSMLT